MAEGKNSLDFLMEILLCLTLKENIFMTDTLCSMSLPWFRGVTYETMEVSGEKVWLDPFRSFGSEGLAFLFFPDDSFSFSLCGSPC